ncbi:hypothetical protein [Litorihabitans aurantiacus]|uniref:Uncharacterized protein n=1 Tax=Litorihabitans aurantiacus TaxID=1930061 RepID=A0AA37XE38_9MICO|nr:hypothetical protein [Litorihabitans aurantiacus]GMA31477.1 hypothetical protein GCM10025875_14690 [Litorihabitans aurantiacus]
MTDRERRGDEPDGPTDDGPHDGSAEAAEPSGRERDWDAEWRTLTQDLTPPRRTYLVSDTPVVGAAQGPRDYSPAPVSDDDDDDAFEAPEADHPPVRRSTRLAWTAIVTGPLLLVLAVVAFRQAPPGTSRRAW